jgi:hypothetical protein
MYTASSQLLVLTNKTGLSLSKASQIFARLVKAFLDIHAFVVRCQQATS